MSGPLALVGGGEWRAGCDFDRDLLAASGASEVAVLPAAAAYEHPERTVEAATEWFASLGATVRPVMALDRAGSHDHDNVTAVQSARFLYIADGSPMHLRSVLMQSPLWNAVVEAWQGGAVVAGSAAGAMVLCDPMVDPRGGAFTLGLGLVSQLGFVPRADTWSEDKLHRTLQLAPPDLPVAGVDERTALLRDPDGTWHAAGAGNVRVWVNGKAAELTALPG
ncbi:MAG TPA: Type 1 glutamine amidotransferase-like domain-containing protein [Microthrixaceae bacterium]|nr:Type 1 glutamine amidotransferase-like domain-containing protein [Microthrixaceae bacterium]